ncbi:MAG: hypothetical protein HQL53_04645 [Magnetococcales bacterium]|nr:hypothetical protein [Magnetococcales bacterium]
MPPRRPSKRRRHHHPVDHHRRSGSKLDRMIYSGLRAIGIALLVGLAFKFVLARVIALTH